MGTVSKVKCPAGKKDRATRGDERPDEVCACGRWYAHDDTSRWRDDHGWLHSRSHCGPASEFVEQSSAPVESKSRGPDADDIAKECDAIKELLLAKNSRYGGSALNPSRIFSKASPVEQLLVRVDDKLSRIRTTGMSAPDEDTVSDLIGYLVLLKIAMRKTA